jgi:hypothetical protein
MPSPELAPSPPRLRLPTTLSFDVFTTVRMLEVSPQIHSCQGPVERDVGPLKVGHRVLPGVTVGGQVRGHEPVHLPVVPRLVLGTPAVAVGGQVLRAGAVRVSVEGSRYLSGLSASY